MNYLVALERKFPKDEDKHIGIEIEFISNVERETIAKYIAAEELDNVNIGTDGSVDDGGVDDGYEMRICCKQSEVKDVMDKVSKILKKVKAKVNDTCGLHIHLDMRNRSYRSALIKLIAAQDFLFSLVEPQRKENRYCRKVLSSRNKQHYNAINGPEAYQKYKTIEVRMHHGTVDCNDIVMWIRVLTELIDNKKKFDPKEKVVKMDSFLTLTKAWILKKQRLYAKTNTESA